MEKNVQTLPKSPGVYLFKDSQGTVIYIGKAKSIKKRVASYFKKNQTDWKVNSLINDYATIDCIVTSTEHEALLLEAQLVKDHQPKYNTLLKDGQPFLYIMLTKTPLPTLKLVRNKKEKGTFFGPFLQKAPARSAYQYLINTFRLKLCNQEIENGCLDYHLDLCAGNCMPSFDSQDYLFRLGLAVDALKKDHRGFLKKLKSKILEYNLQLAFEKSKHLHTYVENFDSIFTTLKARFSPRKFEDAVASTLMPRSFIAPVDADFAIQLQEFLKLDKPFHTIDCFDISHFQSQQLVGSCVRFKDGKPDKNNFRRFNIKTLSEQNDYAALQEVVSRRYKAPDSLPDLIVIDGGKGQLSAAKAVLPAHVACISLAKREETIFSEQYPEGIKLDLNTQIGRLLIALRDYAHHFAITFHRLRRKKSI
ncbi:MAG TPA: GIY-YIG nuclease family protein [Candidatus Babeliales bacterium]|nr:GIY-YIG nuclease family protein [Candidatus Babeliales bacterium]